MTTSTQLDALFDDWLARWHDGNPVSPEHLCADHPELLPQLRKNIEVFIHGQDFLASRGIPTTVIQGDAASSAEVERLPLIPGYELLAKLGEGGMGVVYKARQVFPPRLVALKMPSKMAGLFYHEVEAVAQLEHPNIVRVYAFGEHEGRPYFTMEFVDGGCLQDRLRGGPMTPGDAAALVETLARAMAAAHAKGIVHRDLKPPNVLLTASGEPKISDFGLAIRVGPDGGLSTTGAVVGTPLYMAPEQFLGKTREIGPRTDVYALGIILYHCLTGQPPFTGDSLIEIQRLVLSDDPAPVRRLQPRVPRDLETVCHKCLQKEPDQRYKSAAALAEDLRRFRAGEHIEARPVGVGERALRWVKRRPLLVALAAAILLLLGGSALWTFATVERGRQEVWWQNARKLQELGDEQFKRRDLDAASQEYDDAEAIYKDLRAAPVRMVAGTDDFRLAHARLLIRRGEIFLERRQFGEGKFALTAAIEELRNLGPINSRNPAFLLPLAEAHHTLGTLYHDQNSNDALAEAEAHYERGLRIRKDLYEANKDNPSYKRDLALSHGFLGDTQMELGKFAEARESYEEAKRLRGELADESLCYHGRDWGNLAALAEWKGELDDAIKLQQERRTYYQEHLPGVLLPDKFQTERLDADVFLAELRLLKAGDAMPPQEVKELLDAARRGYDQLPGDGGRPQVLSARAQIELASGKYHALAGDRDQARDRFRAALAWLDQLGDDRSRADDLCRRASACVWLSRLEDDKAKADMCQDDALASLEKAVAKGFKHRKRLELDAGFRQLKDDRRRRFDGIVAGIK